PASKHPGGSSNSQTDSLSRTPPGGRSAYSTAGLRTARAHRHYDDGRGAPDGARFRETAGVAQAERNRGMNVCAVLRDSMTLPAGHARRYTASVSPPRNPSLTAEQRRVLELLAGSPRGYTKGRLLADGFTVDILADLVREGLATPQRGTLRVGGR